MPTRHASDRKLNRELERYFRLRWEADRRAIKRWQAAGLGRELTWPDHADLVVWLLEENDKLRAELAQLGRPSIECPKCHRVSYNPNDIREKFCGVCGYHEEPR